MCAALPFTLVSSLLSYFSPFLPFCMPFSLSLSMSGSGELAFPIFGWPHTRNIFTSPVTRDVIHRIQRLRRPRNVELGLTAVQRDTFIERLSKRPVQTGPLFVRPNYGLQRGPLCRPSNERYTQQIDGSAAGRWASPLVAFND